jgi:hypothetical protein
MSVAAWCLVSGGPLVAMALAGAERMPLSASGADAIQRGVDDDVSAKLTSVTDRSDRVILLHGIRYAADERLRRAPPAAGLSRHACPQA